MGDSYYKILLKVNAGLAVHTWLVSSLTSETIALEAPMTPKPNKIKMLLISIYNLCFRGTFSSFNIT